MTFSSLCMEENQVRGQTWILGSFTWITTLVYQAQGQYERAAAQFSHLLQTEEELSLMGSDGALHAKHSGKDYSGALTAAGNEINVVHALTRFDEGDYQAAWSYLDLTPKTSNMLTLDPKLALQRSEQMLLQAMLLQSDGKVDKVPREIEKAKLMLDEVLSVLPFNGLTEAAAYSTQLHCISVFEEGYKPRGGQEQSEELQTIMNSYNQVMASPISTVHQDCNLWLKVFHVYRVVLLNFPMTLQLCQKLMNLSRKQSNFAMVHRLSHYLKDNIASCSDEVHHKFLSLDLQNEEILLMHAENHTEDAFTSLWSFAIANSTLATFLHVVGSELIQKYLGEGPKLVRELFRIADDLSPSIVFINEIDAVGTKRRALQQSSTLSKA
ncbi:hypothetical protein IFM89_034399 [Coptis chinensis]|uniref:ATPase AAA-type core domain-containing protein n=1 Tax=Coptis chinensis TaxID=261450 RepID=A0A835IWI8_9MAGN|nr:hypothetical protein IFM89_034399 [Coptis chinensis]